MAEKYPQAASLIKDLESEPDIRVLYGVDATKLAKAGKEIRKGKFDRIVFNFPHVGGLTKDVNRQVRHNQGVRPLGYAFSTKDFSSLTVSSQSSLLASLAPPSPC